jgi:hypothetical protein
MFAGDSQGVTWIWLSLFAVAALATVPFVGTTAPRARLVVGVIGDLGVFALGTLLLYFVALGSQDTGSIGNLDLFIEVGAGVALAAAVAVGFAQRRAVTHQRRERAAQTLRDRSRPEIK